MRNNSIYRISFYPPYLVALLCAGYPAAQFENGSVLKFGPLTQN